MSLWEDYRDESLADDAVRKYEKNIKRVLGGRGTPAPKTRRSTMKGASKPFEARYGGYCGLCSGDVDRGDEVCFVEDEICHLECAESEGWVHDPVEEAVQEASMTFTFDPDEMS